MRTGLLVRACLAMSGCIAVGPSAATAQVYIGGRGGMLAVPGVSIRIGGGVAGLPAYGLPRRRWAGGALYATPPAAPPVGVYAQRRLAARQAAIDAQRLSASDPTTVATSAATSELPLPTAQELAAMADGDLLNSVIGLSAQLDADLNRFSSAASWQRHLKLPPDALPPPENGRVTLGIRSLHALEAKFESVAANPNFSQIFSLPSFAATRMALQETIERFESAQAAHAPSPGPAESDSPATEELPLPPVTPAPTAAASSARSPANSVAPALVAPLNPAAGERSILLSK